MNKRLLEIDRLKLEEDKEYKEKELENFFYSITVEEKMCIMLYIHTFLKDDDENRQIAIKTYSKIVEERNSKIINNNKGII